MARPQDGETSAGTINDAMAEEQKMEQKEDAKAEEGEGDDQVVQKEPKKEEERMQDENENEEVEKEEKGVGENAKDEAKAAEKIEEVNIELNSDATEDPEPMTDEAPPDAQAEEQAEEQKMEQKEDAVAAEVVVGFDESYTFQGGSADDAPGEDPAYILADASAEDREVDVADDKPSEDAAAEGAGDEEARVPGEVQPEEAAAEGAGDEEARVPGEIPAQDDAPSEGRPGILQVEDAVGAPTAYDDVASFDALHSALGALEASAGEPQDIDGGNAESNIDSTFDAVFAQGGAQDPLGDPDVLYADLFIDSSIAYESAFGYSENDPGRPDDEPDYTDYVPES